MFDNVINVLILALENEFLEIIYILLGGRKNIFSTTKVGCPFGGSLAPYQIFYFFAGEQLYMCTLS